MRPLITFFNKTALLLLVILLIQARAVAQINGPTTPSVGATYTYTYNDGTVYTPGAGWLITNGTITSSSVSSSVFTVNVQWSSAGAGTLTFKYKFGTISTLNVNVCNVAIYTVSGGGDICNGTPASVTITLSGSQTGVNYQRFFNGSPKNTIAGTGGPISWTNNSAGDHTVVATETSTGCTATMNGMAHINNPSINVFTLSGGGTSCAGSGSSYTLTQNGSQTGINYQLQLNGANSGSPKAGTGSALTWPAQTTNGTYTVLAQDASSACTGAMTGSAVITANPLPTSFTVGGGGAQCTAESGATITLSGSESGVNYTLKYNGNNNAAPVAGTGSTLSWPGRTLEGTYTVTAANATTGCSQSMSGNAVVSFNPSPAAYNVGGGGSYCSGGSGVSIALDNSFHNTTYQLKRNGVSTGAPVSGTLSAITWPSQTAAGTYTVTATFTSPGCSAEMNGSAVVSINPLPVAYTVGGGGSYCSGASGLSVTLNGSEANTDYHLLLNGTDTNNSITGIGVQHINWVNQTAAGTYTSVATNTATGCTQPMSGSTAVTVNPVPTVAITSSQTLCSGQTTSFTLSNPNAISGTTFGWTQSASNVSGASNGSGAAISQVLTSSNGTTQGTVTYTATATANGCNSTVATATATVNPVPQITNTAPQLLAEGCNSFAVNFTPAISIAGASFSWSSTATAGISGNTSSGTGSITNTLANASSTATGSATYTITPSLNGCIGTAKNYVATLLPVVSTVNVNGPAVLVYGAITQLSIPATGVYYQWKLNGTDLAGATQSNVQVNQAGDYTVSIRATASSTVACASSVKTMANTLAVQAAAVNYVSTTRILKPGVAPATSLYALAPNELVQSIAYQDGIGRTFQSVAVGLSPLQTDLVSAQGYGKQGITDSTFLPYAAAVKDGRFRLNAIRAASAPYGYSNSEQQQFYQNAIKVAHDGQPFARTVHRATPDARVTEQGAPGSDWQPGNHTVKNLITLNTGTYPVRYWKADGTTTANYPVNTVQVSITTDENGNQVRTYTDKRGLTVYKQVQEGATSWLNTYYVYDDFGRLIYQLPPKALSTLGIGASIAATNSTVSELIYKYVYDVKGRLIEKKVPGSVLQYLVYDNLDRVVLTQDGNLRAGNNWMFIKYDNKNRPVYSGLYQNSTQTTRPAVQALFDVIDYTTAPRYESEQVNATYQGYSNNVFPTAGLTLMSANYYDHYDFDRNGTADYSYDNTHLTGIPAAASTATRGLTTGSKKVTIDAAGAFTTNWLTSVVFYDSFDRAVQTLSNNHLNLTLQDKSSVLYDFAGHALKTHTTHVGTTTVNTASRLTYDHAWRKTGVFQEVEEPVTWTAQVGVQATGNTVTKTAATALWDAGALSQNSIAAGQDGWMEFRVNEVSSYKMLGLSPYNNNPSYESINYAIYAVASGEVIVYESGTMIGVFGTYVATDIFRVERIGGVVYYKRNGQVFYTSAVTSNDTLYADASIYSTMTSLVDVHLSSGGDKQLAAYEYNALGQAVDKKLHNTGGSNFLQSVDYRYDIKGQLLSINNAQLANDGTTNDEANDYFGIELMYNTADVALGNTAYYNGNISALKWKGMGGGSGTADQRSYKYNYDKSDRLKDATFQAYGSGAWNKEANTLNENMTYDVNGNVATLTRKQNQRGLSGLTVTSTAQAIDNLSYTYTTGNQISKVEDSGTTAGFNNGVVNGTTEYTYATDGSLTKDDNKGISAIAYNILGKPKQVTFTNGNVIAYTYAADGSKLKMATTVNSVTTTTDYAGNYVYTNNTLSFFGAPEGRVVRSGSSYDYQYAIADHQGNTRVVFSSATPVAQPVVADFEATANSGVQNYPTGGSRSSLNLYDHSDAGTTYTYSQLLNAGYSSQVGVAKSYKVYPGDKVKIEAYAKYSNATSTSSNVSAFASALLSAFGVPAPVGGEVGTISSALNNWGGLVAGGSGGSSSGPKAFVNIIVFDKDYKFLDAAYEAVDPSAQQVGVSPNIAHDYMSREYTAKEAGYVFMYISNENSTQVDVYFDDVTMTYTPSNIIQYNEYYPFGLQTAQSWTRENNTGNNFLGNGGTEFNNTSNLYDLDCRNYDPILGRMNQVDPIADKYSSLTPYNFGFNNPATWTDVNGADPSPGEPDYVTRRGLQLMGDAFYQDNAGSSSQYRHQWGNNANLFDMNWGGGFGNIGGMGLGNQAMYDFYTMSNDQYVANYGTTITDRNSINAIYNAGQTFASGAFGSAPADGRQLAVHRYNGDYVQVDALGRLFVPYTDVSYGAYRKDRALNRLLNGLQTGLDVAGVVPVIGEVADGINAGIYTLRGDYVNAGLSGAAMIPFLGWGATGAKLGKKGYTTVYRAVSKAELDDIAKYGFRNKAGAYETGKLFAPTLEEAAKFGKNNFMFDGLPNTLIKVQVPNSVMNGAFKFGADGMNALSIPANQLHLLQATPLNYSPLIR